MWRFASFRNRFLHSPHVRYRNAPGTPGESRIPPDGGTPRLTIRSATPGTEFERPDESLPNRTDADSGRISRHDDHTARGAPRYLHPPREPPRMQDQRIDVDRHRQPDHAVETLILHRWSARAMSGGRLSGAELMSLFEAGPLGHRCRSTSNPGGSSTRSGRANTGSVSSTSCPRTIAAGPEPRRFSSWVLSRTTFERNGNPSRTHSYDTGAAWQNIALQGCRMGLVVHGMAGFDYDKARAVLGGAGGIRGRSDDCDRPPRADRGASRIPAGEGGPVGQETGERVRVSGGVSS